MDLFEEKNILPMLISDMQNPFNSPDFIYELKLDGIRCIAYLDETGTDLRNKRNMKLLPRFPELKDIYLNVNSKCILDGELIILKNGVPDFYELQRRTMLTDKFKIELAYNNYPASFVAYDILYINGKEMIHLPLINRKEILENTINEDVYIAISRYVEEKGIELFHLADQQKLEGVVAKNINSKYYFDKRTKDWIKFKRMADEDFIICGYISKGPKSNTLLLGKYKNGSLIYKGSVSFGVRTEHFNWNKINSSPFNLNPFNDRDITWVEPTLVCVVEYMPNTKNALRQPVFKGIRDDVTPEDVRV